MKHYIAIAATLSILPVGTTFAQEFELDLDFDFEFEDVQVIDTAPSEVGALEEVEPLVTAEPESRIPDVSLSATFGSSRFMGTATQSRRLQFDLSDQYDLGAIGYLEWAGHVAWQDPASPDEISTDLDKIILQNSRGNFSWKLGKFPIGWGEVEGVPVLDVLNGSMSIANAGTATEDLPGQWFLTGDYFLQDMTLSAFIGPNPIVGHAMAPAASNHETEFGARLKIPNEKGQVSLYAAHLLPQAGVVDQSNSTSSAAPFDMVGLSAHRVVGAFLLELDLAAKLGLERSSISGLSTHDRVDMAAGFEFAASDTAQLSFALAAQHWLEQADTYYDFGAGVSVESPQTSASYMLMLSNSLMDGSVGVSAVLGGGLDGATRFLALNGSYAVSDAFHLEMGVSRLFASPGSLLEPLDGAENITIAVKYFF